MGSVIFGGTDNVYATQMASDNRVQNNLMNVHASCKTIVGNI